MNKLFLTFTLAFVISTNAAFADHPEGIVKVDIYGLVCDFCARALEKVFGKEEAVDNIDVDLDEKIITIHIKQGHHIDNELIRQYIVDSGYNVETIHRGG